MQRIEIGVSVPLRGLWFEIFTEDDFETGAKGMVSVPLRGLWFEIPCSGKPDFMRLHGAVCGADLFFAHFLRRLAGKMPFKPCRCWRGGDFFYRIA